MSVMSLCNVRFGCNCNGCNGCYMRGVMSVECILDVACVMAEAWVMSVIFFMTVTVVPFVMILLAVTDVIRCNCCNK